MDPLEQLIDIEQLKADLAFSDVNIQSAFMEHSALYVEYGRHISTAQYQMDRAKSLLALVEAKIDSEIREDAERKPTEKSISNQIILDARFQAAEKRYHEARKILSLCKEATQSMVQRRDMLVQLGVSLREELKGKLRVIDDSTPGERAVAVLTGNNSQGSGAT